MLDIISMTILVIVMLLVGILIVLILIGANMSKTDYEKELDDEEQMKYLLEYRERKQKESSDKNEK